MWIILILVAVPIIEIALFIELGGWVGLWPTIGLVIVTAILGGLLLRMQGFAAMQRLQSSVAEGGDPRGPLAHGVMILVAGLLMLTPGFFTDAVGFSLLIPPVRAALIRALGSRLKAHVVTTGFQNDPGPQQPQSDDILDADYVVVDEEEVSKGNSGWTKRED